MNDDVFLVDGARSAIGRYGGSLASLRASAVAATVADAALARGGIPRKEIALVVGGMVLQDMTESNPARIVGQRLGLEASVPAFTVNMQCASGMAALILGAQNIALGASSCVLVAAMESMSGAPYTVAGPRWGLKLGHAEFTDALQECKLAGSKLWGDPWNMIDVAEHHAVVDGVSREEMDAYAVLTHRRAADAIEGGRFAREIIGIDVPASDVSVRFQVDEHVRPDVSVESLARLRPVRDGGTITAGNAAGQNDGAAVAILASESVVRRLGLEPLARVVVASGCLVGCDPHVMGYSAVLAANAAMAQAGVTLNELDLIECNEGFAVQMIACQRMGGWPADRLNVDGGSVALGHPVGMSGLRIAVHLAHSLQQRDLRRGLATVPAGSGLGAAVVLERP